MTKRTHKERQSKGEETLEQVPQETLQQKLFKAPDEMDEGDIMSGVNNTYSFRGWWNAILAIPIDRYEQRASVYQRALSHLPGSYKLWFNFLKESRLYVKQFDLIEQSDFYEVVNQLHEQALIYMKAMPRIWLDYAKFVGKQKQISKTRKVYDRALQNLPVTQHHIIWQPYLEWATSFAEQCPWTAQSCYKRYIKLKPDRALDYVDFLLRHDLLEEALRQYIFIINSETNFLQKSLKSKFDLTMELCEFISKYPARASNLGKLEGKIFDAKSVLRDALE